MDISWDYHLKKTELCADKSIRLIHVFEDEIREKFDIVISVVLQKLGIVKEKIPARKCDIVEIDGSLYKKFLDDNHIQGWVATPNKYGMFYDSELVGVIGVGKSRFSSNPNELEIYRLCWKKHTIVMGGTEKFLSYLEKKFKGHTLVSYVDRRFFTGASLVTAGFELVSITKPNYYYVDFNKNKRYSRIEFQKHKLKDKLEDFNENYTEQENMLANGYGILYDCGNYVFKRTI